VRVPDHLSAHGAQEKGTQPAVAAGPDNDQVGLVRQLHQDGGRLSLKQLALTLTSDVTATAPMTLLSRALASCSMMRSSDTS
jgi:hypothetical protein